MVIKPYQMFSQTKSQEIDNQATIVYDSVMKVGELLEKSQGRLNYLTQPEIEKLDRLIGEFIKKCNLNQSSVSTVNLNGQMMPLTAMFMVTRRIIEDIEANTGYVFKCKS